MVVTTRSSKKPAPAQKDSQTTCTTDDTAPSIMESTPPSPSSKATSAPLLTHLEARQPSLHPNPVDAAVTSPDDVAVHPTTTLYDECFDDGIDVAALINVPMPSDAAPTPRSPSTPRAAVKNPYVSSKSVNPPPPIARHTTAISVDRSSSKNDKSSTPNDDNIPSFADIYTSHNEYLRSSAQLEDKSSLRSLAAGASNVSDAYYYRRKKVVRKFLDGLRACSPKYDRLLEETSNLPSNFNTQEQSVPLLFVVLSGSDDKKRKARVLSDMLVDWISNLRRVRSASSEEEESSSRVGIARKKERNTDGGVVSVNVDSSPAGYTYPHAPSTINTYVRTLLSAGKEYYNWDFCVGYDFSFEGGYCAFFKRLCQLRQRENVSFICC